MTTTITTALPASHRPRVAGRNAAPVSTVSDGRQGWWAATGPAATAAVTGGTAPADGGTPAAVWADLTGWTSAHPLLVGAAVAGLVVAVVVVVLARDAVQRWRHQRLSADARWVTIAAPPQVDADSAAAVWTTLAGILTPSRRTRLIYGTAHVAWEYTWAARTLTIRLWVPGTIPPGAVEAAIAAAWPGSTTTTEPAGDPIPTANGAEEAGGALWPQHPDVLPLRTDHDADPLRALVAAGACVQAREHACVQVLARPATARRVAAARRAASTAPGTAPGGSALVGVGEDAVTRAVTGVARVAAEAVGWLVDVLVPGPTRTARTNPAGRAGAGLTGAGRGDLRRDPVTEAHRRAAGEKAVNLPHFEIAVRYAVATTPPATSSNARTQSASSSRASTPRGARTDGPTNAGGRSRRGRFSGGDRLDGLAHTLASAAATYTRPNRLRRMRMAHPVQVLAGRRLRRGFLATVEELAVLAALPRDLAVPGLDRARAKAMPAPPAIPTGGRNAKVLGRAQIGAHAVALNVTDARQHVHLVGKTGTGKSTLLLNLVLSDVHAHRGVVVIDPRGDLVTDILDRLPLDAAHRTVIIDPAQPHPACFNPLDTTGTDTAGDPHLAVDNIVGIFSKIFGRHWGPRIDDTLRVSCLTLMRRPQPTLSMIPRLLNDRSYRATFTRGLNDPEGLQGFWTWYDSMNDGLRAQVIGPVLARLRAFLLRDFVKDVIGNAHSSFQMTDILNGGILLCRLPKGILGEDTARILGSLIVARTWQAAIARAATPEDQRRDATLVIDECHNFLTLPGSVDDMLAEARGFRLGLVLAHQDLAQLPKETQAAVSANARSKIYFNVAPEDAKDLSRHTLPELDDHDLAHLDVHTATARLLVNGRERPAFTFTTNPPPPPQGHRDTIRAICATAHARTQPTTPTRHAEQQNNRQHADDPPQDTVHDNPQPDRTHSGDLPPGEQPPDEVQSGELQSGDVRAARRGPYDATPASDNGTDSATPRRANGRGRRDPKRNGHGRGDRPMRA